MLLYEATGTRTSLRRVRSRDRYLLGCTLVNGLDGAPEPPIFTAGVGRR
jgi:hypothetical protein